MTSSSYIEYYLPFYMLLVPYKFGIINLGTIGLLITAALTLLKNNFIFIWRGYYNRYLLFFAYCLLRDFIDLLFGASSAKSQINLMIEYTVLFFLVFIVCSVDFDEDKLYKAWRFAGTIYGLGLLYHIIMLYAFRKSVTPISIIPGYSLRDVEFVATNRPSSFFSEPAAFVSAMMPLEFLALKRRDLKYAILSTILILLATSTVGIILSVVLWISIIVTTRRKNGKKSVLVFILFLLVAFFMVVPAFNESYIKFLEVAEGGSTFGSRVEAGFEVVSTLKPTELLFGTLFNEVSDYMAVNASLFDNSSKAINYYLRTGSIYLNTISVIIFKYGLIGVIFYWVTFKDKFSIKDYEAKVFLIMCLVTAFGQSSILGNYYYMLTMIILLYYHKCDMNKIN